MRRKAAALALVAALVVAGAVALAPRAPKLGSEVSGDGRLAADASAALEGQQGMRALAVARVERGRVTTAGLGRGVDARTRFELGSVTKPLTGMLLSELARRGEVRLNEPVGRLVGRRLAGTDVASASLTQLATHHSGLPRLPVSATGLARVVIAQVGARDPYGAVTPAGLIEAAGEQGTGGRGKYAYSNLGMSLLGQALAIRAEVSYPALLRRRVLSPLGMDDTVVVGPGQTPPTPRVAGTKAGGRSTSPWRSLGYAPAGLGVWSNAEDLGRLLRRALARTAPGQAATRPLAPTDDPGERIGLGWQTERRDRHRIVWHNGATGGFRTFVGFEPDRDRGIALLAATSRSVDPAGMRMLGVEVEQGGFKGLRAVVLTLLGCFGGVLALLSIARRAQGRFSPKADRLLVVSSVVSALALLLLARQLGAWDRIPSAVWVLGVVVCLAGAVAAARRWPELPLARQPRPTWRWAATATSVLVSMALAVLALA